MYCLQEIAFSWRVIDQYVMFKERNIFEVLDLFTFYTQMYSTAAVILFSILTWALALSYRTIGVRVQGVRKQLNDAFQRNLSRNLHEWATWIDNVDHCNKLMNEAFAPVLFIEIISIFLRVLSMGVEIWIILDTKLYYALAYNVPTIMKYMLHLWLICFTIDANIREVRS